MTQTMSTSDYKCLCPHRTSDVVTIVRQCVTALGTAFKPLGTGTVLEHVFEKIGEAMKKDMTSGIVLIQTRQVQIERLPNGGGVMEVVPYGGYPGRDYGCIEAARAEGDQIISSGFSVREHRGGGMATLTWGSCFVVAPAQVCAGQMAHPRQLSEELDLIAGAWREAKVGDDLSFIASLEEACLNAHANGSVCAGVAIYRSVNSAQYKAVHGANRASCEVQAERILPGSKCVCIPVRQHDEME